MSSSTGQAQGGRRKPGSGVLRADGTGHALCWTRRLCSGTLAFKTSPYHLELVRMKDPGHLSRQAEPLCISARSPGASCAQILIKVWEALCCKKTVGGGVEIQSPGFGKQTFAKTTPSYSNMGVVVVGGGGDSASLRSEARTFSRLTTLMWVNSARWPDSDSRVL